MGGVSIEVAKPGGKQHTQHKGGGVQAHPLSVIYNIKKTRNDKSGEGWRFSIHSALVWSTAFRTITFHKLI